MARVNGRCLLDPMASDEEASGSILESAPCSMTCDACQHFRQELDKEKALNAQLQQNLEDLRRLVEQKAAQIQRLQSEGTGANSASQDLLAQELQQEVSGLRRTLAKKCAEEDRMRDKVFTAELQRDAALVKFHTEGQKLIRRIQV